MSRPALLSLVDPDRLADACTRIYELPHWVETSELLVHGDLPPDEHRRHVDLLRADLQAIAEVGEVGVQLQRLLGEVE